MSKDIEEVPYYNGLKPHQNLSIKTGWGAYRTIVGLQNEIDPYRGCSNIPRQDRLTAWRGVLDTIPQLISDHTDNKGRINDLAVDKKAKEYSRKAVRTLRKRGGCE